MSSLGDLSNNELVVADDGSIPADQLRRLGVLPGTHLRVVESATGNKIASLAGSLPDLPDLSWEDFERASALAGQDSAPA